MGLLQIFEPTCNGHSACGKDGEIGHVAKRPTVAVFFEGNTGQGFIQALSQTGRFEIVERGQLKRALSEFDLTKTGKVDLATAQHAGRLSVRSSCCL